MAEVRALATAGESGKRFCHMPQCVAFELTRQAVRVVCNSAWGHHVAMGPQKKRGPTFKRVPGPKNVYFNHCAEVLYSHKGELGEVGTQLGRQWIRVFTAD